jgi:hypothetical protein
MIFSWQQQIQLQNTDLIINDNQQDVIILYLFIYLFLVCCTCLGRFLRPSSGANKYTYSFGYFQPILLLAGIMNEMELEFQMELEFRLIHDTS